jgi:hypothetical protein
MSAKRPIPVIDGLLAATAKVRGLILVTRNDAQVRELGPSPEPLQPWLKPFHKMRPGGVVFRRATTFQREAARLIDATLRWRRRSSALSCCHHLRR